MIIRGAIFDLDGTLLDSMPMWDTLGTRYLKQYGISAPPSLSEILFSMTEPEAARYLSQTYLPALPAKRIEAEITSLVADSYQKTLPLKEGADSFVSALFQKGIAMCVLTATTRSLACAALQRTGILPFFREVISCGDRGESKHAPVTYLNVLPLLGTHRSETLVFEDAAYAVSSAKTAGLPVAAVYDAASAKETAYLQKTADFYLPALRIDLLPPIG